MAVVKLTENKIRSLPFGSGIHRDEIVKGLMVICHKSTRTYAAQGDVRRNGRHVRTVRVKIDRVDRIGLAEARRKAKNLMSQIQSGIDPTAGPPETGITLLQALKAHIAERDLAECTIEGYESIVRNHLGRFRNRAVADITRQDCRELLDTITRKCSRIQAGSVLRVLRAVINTAMRIDETILRNPTDAVKIPVPPVRKVAPIDLADWWQKTERQTPLMRDLHRALLLTGARKGSMTPVKREHVDLENRILTFKHMKTGNELLYPMGERLTEILQERMNADEMFRSEWLWHSPPSSTGYIREAKRPDLPSPHVLRHLARTMMIAAGVPYAESALLLGHKLPGASGGYVHPEHLVEALRPHAQALENYIFRVASQEI
ncbi:MAG: tyrosine-type recombinase/integrase [Pseudomonadota bacterium]